MGNKCIMFSFHPLEGSSTEQDSYLNRQTGSLINRVGVGVGVGCVCVCVCVCVHAFGCIPWCWDISGLFRCALLRHILWRLLV